MTLSFNGKSFTDRCSKPLLAINSIAQPQLLSLKTAMRLFDIDGILQNGGDLGEALEIQLGDSTQSESMLSSKSSRFAPLREEHVTDTPNCGRKTRGFRVHTTRVTH